MIPMHTRSVLQLCLVAFVFLGLSNALPALPPGSLSALAPPDLIDYGLNRSLSSFIPQTNSTNNGPQLGFKHDLTPQHVDNAEHEMTLYMEYTGWWLYTKPLDRLLRMTENLIFQQVYQQGTKSRLISKGNGDQSFIERIPGGLTLEVTNLIPWGLTWGVMQDLIRGLQEWCSYTTCRFEFSVEDSPVRIGKGEISWK